MSSFYGGAEAPSLGKVPTKRDESLCLSLLPLFNFSEPSKVTYADWQRGTRSMGLSLLADDPSVWSDLAGLYGDGATAQSSEAASVYLEQVAFLVPLEGHLTALLRAVVFAIDHVKDFAATQTRRNVRASDSRINSMILRKRREICLPMLTAWHSFIVQQRASNAKVLKVASRAAKRGLTRALNHWRAQRDERARLRVFMRRLRNRGQLKALLTWMDAAAERKRLRGFGTRLQNRDLVKAFGSWMQVASEGVRLQAFGKRLVGRHLIKGFNTWSAVADERIDMRTCTRAHAHTCTHAHVRTCTHAHACARAPRTHVLACARTQACAHVYSAHMRTCAHAHMRTCAHAHMHACIVYTCIVHTWMHTHTCIHPG